MNFFVYKDNEYFLKILFIRVLNIYVYIVVKLCNLWVCEFDLVLKLIVFL